MDTDAFLETRTVLNITRLQEARLISSCNISVFDVTFCSCCTFCVSQCLDSYINMKYEAHWSWCNHSQGSNTAVLVTVPVLCQVFSLNETLLE
jgi:hypothetical protein